MHTTAPAQSGLDPLFWMPIQKAYESKEILDEDGQPSRIIEGWASVDDAEPDLQNDFVSVDGIDDSLFLRDKIIKGKRCKMGAINWAHSDEPEHHLGRPIAAHKGENFYHIEARLDKGGKSDSIWEKLRLNKPHEHGFGFSLQGVAKARDPQDPRRITKCFIHKISITPQDINTKTWVDVLHKGLDFRSIEFVSDESASHKEGEMSRQAREALVVGASKVLGRQESGKASQLLKKGLRMLGLGESDAARLAEETKTALKKGYDDKDDDKDNDDKEEPVAKGGCAHEGMKGKHCSDCGAAIKKSLNVLDFVSDDPDADQIMDATPYLRRLAKGVSVGLENLSETIDSVLEPLAKANAASMAQVEEYKDLSKKIIDAQTKAEQERSDLKKSIESIVAVLGTAGKQPAESIRKSVDGTLVEDKTAKREIQAMEPIPGEPGMVRYAAIDTPTRMKLEQNIQKAVTDNALDQDLAGVYLTDLQKSGWFKAYATPGLDLLRAIPSN